MADEKIGPIPEPAMTDEELMELMENIFTPGAGAIKTAGKVIPKIGKEAIKILNKILNRNKKAIKDIEQSNKIREKLFKKALEDKSFMKDLAERNPQMVMDAKGNFIGATKEIKKALPVIQEQLARATGRMPMNYTPIARATAQRPMQAQVLPKASSSILKQLAKLSPLATLQSDSELQEPLQEENLFEPKMLRSSLMAAAALSSPKMLMNKIYQQIPEDDDLNFPSILEELISEPR